ncbi:MAG: cation diffusion facilitator family transporter [Clostridia bacterium]|nr:cation diffusion facilitator family transporter [Clostridia bacterium]
MEQTNLLRTKRGVLVSAVGIVLNFLLAAAKIVCGILFGLVSLTADGVNNLSDCGSGAASLVSFRVAAKPADKEHPYGHQRAEYVASMIIGFFVLLLAVELLRESAEKIAAGGIPHGSCGIYILLGVSVLVKGGMFVLYRITAKRIGSDTLRAASVDSLCDCFATLAVALGLVLAEFSVPADGYAGLAVALFIGWEGVGILREASSKLLGQAPDPALIERIREIILNGNGVLGLHDLRAYRYGPDKFFATVHIEMSAGLPALSSHAIIDGLERRVAEDLGVELSAHLDPVDLQDSEAQELEERLRAAAEGMVEGLDLHDFRLIRGATVKFVFEAGVPFSCPKSDREILNDLERAVRVLGDYEPVIGVERE